MLFVSISILISDYEIYYSFGIFQAVWMVIYSRFNYGFYDTSILLVVLSYLLKVIFVWDSLVTVTTNSYYRNFSFYQFVY